MRTRKWTRNFGKDLTNQQSAHDSFISSTQRHKKKENQFAKDKTSKAEQSLKSIKMKQPQGSLLQERVHEIMVYGYSFFQKYLGTHKYVSSLVQTNKQSQKQISKQLEQKKYMFSICPQLTLSMRNILVQWLIEIHKKMSLRYETLFMTIYLIDNYCSRRSVAKSEYQLLAMACVFIAGKYQEIATPKLKKIMSLCDKLYESHQVLQMESKVLMQLNFKISQPSLNWFLGTEMFVINLEKGSILEGMECRTYRKYEKVCYYLLQLCLFEIELLKNYSPQVISNAVLYVVSMQSQFVGISTHQCAIGLNSFDLNQLRQCSSKVTKVYQDRDNRKYDAVNTKYCSFIVPHYQNEQYSMFQ